MPASRSALAMILAPRSCPSRPGFATTTRILLWLDASVLMAGVCRLLTWNCVSEALSERRRAAGPGDPSSLLGCPYSMPCALQDPVRRPAAARGRSRRPPAPGLRAYLRERPEAEDAPRRRPSARVAPLTPERCGSAVRR